MKDTNAPTQVMETIYTLESRSKAPSGVSTAAVLTHNHQLDNHHLASPGSGLQKNDKNNNNNNYWNSYTLPVGFGLAIMVQ